MPKTRRKDGRHTTLFVIGAIGAILFWRGIWELADKIPIIENQWVSIAAGLVLLVVSHQIYREL